MRLSTLSLAVLLAFAPAAFAQDKPDAPAPESPKKADGDGDKKGEEKEKPKSAKLPFNPLADAKKGDWSYFSGKLSSPGDGPAEKKSLIFKVKRVEDDSVTLSVGEVGGEEGAPGKTTRVPKKEDVTVEEYIAGLLNMPAGKDTTIEDAKKTVGEKEFDCKKIVFKIAEEGVSVKGTVWIAKEIKGSGMVALDFSISAQGMKQSFECELQGYGHKDKADFGKAPPASDAKEGETTPKKPDGDGPKKPAGEEPKKPDEPKKD